GIPTLLLDVPGNDPADKNSVVRAGVERARKARPAAFMDSEISAQEKLLTLGNTADDLGKLREVDWIVEAIIEKPAAKRALWERVEKVAGERTIFSSNSSGIPMSVQSEGRSESFRRRFLGAHFYNPPRWLYLLELIPTEATAPEVLQTVREFGDRVLGKGIVIARDVPGFIGNRIGVYALLHAARTMEELQLTPEFVDVLTGPMLGRPKSATLRTLDAVGLDVLGFISEDLTRALDAEENFNLPPSMRALLARGDRGEKSGRGYYQRVKNADGTSTILALNLETLDYENRKAELPPEVAAIGKLKSAVERTKALLALPATSPAGEFTRRTIFEMLHFAAEKHGVVADSVVEIDNALKWGFGWELGPFELIDALGIEQVATGIEKNGDLIPVFLAEHRASGAPFYPTETKTQASANSDGLIVLKDLKRDPARTLASNAAAALVDLGDDVLLLEFTSKANAVNADVYALAERAKEVVVARAMRGLVIGNQGRWFSAGADLGALLADCRAGNRAAVEAMIVGFQKMTTGLRAAPFPVVCAPFGMTLGGGCETMLYSDHVQTDAELTTGLVELNVGLMPSAGGTTEMLARFQAQLASGDDPFIAVERAFDLISSRTITASAREAQRLGFLRSTDSVTMNKRRVLSDAKDTLLALAASDYIPPAPRELHAVGEPGYQRLVEKARAQQASGKWTEYDVHLASELARILTGGGAENHQPGALPEARFLELEREIFIGLCFRPESQARIEHTLKTGKPLRN
ncbi:MAG: enoyl-CoA hydratase/isomerase family protein, partial [Verrucomicrobia bacterium]|nr:enoyl-CoA hydratase/isomerase family protein [Verrucomicrobiota bacterium]